MHPQYRDDIREVRRIKARALTGDHPKTSDVPAIAALMMRYRRLPLSDSICQELSETMYLWGMNPEILNRTARSIWNAGYRPGSYGDYQDIPKVGSHFDTQDNG